MRCSVTAARSKTRRRVSSKSRQPSRRFVDDANVAGLIGFLCGPHSADINGAALPIDGGWIAGR